MAKPSSGNTYTLTNWGTGYNLDQFGGYTENGTNVIQWTANSSNTGQHWKYSGNRLYPENSSVVCLDRYIAAGSTFNNADLWKATTTDAAQQILELIETGEGKDLYTITLLTARENGKVLYLTASRKPSGASNNASGKAPGANGNVYWSSTRTANQNYQKWRFSEVSGGGSNPDPGENDGDGTYGTLVANLTKNCYTTNINPFLQYGKPERGDGFNHVWCTLYCWGRAYEVTGGTRLPMTTNANTWYSNYSPDGTFTKRTAKQGPVDNCIAVLDNVKDTPQGHVVFIEKVLSDRVYYTEGNILKMPDGVVRTATITGTDTKTFQMKMKDSADATGYYTGTVLGYLVPNKK